MQASHSPLLIRDSLEPWDGDYSIMWLLFLEYIFRSITINCTIMDQELAFYIVGTTFPPVLKCDEVF